MFWIENDFLDQFTFITRRRLFLIFLHHLAIASSIDCIQKTLRDVHVGIDGRILGRDLFVEAGIQTLQLDVFVGITEESNRISFRHNVRFMVGRSFDLVESCLEFVVAPAHKHLR